MKSLTILVVVAIAFTLVLGQDETSSGTEGGGDGTEGGHHGGRKPHPDCPGWSPIEFFQVHCYMLTSYRCSFKT